MPVFRLTDQLIFPDPELAREDGILAVGGDLSAERLLIAYSHGIFPWFNEGDPILWWSPNPRCILFPEDLKVSKSMRKFLRKSPYRVTFDNKFREVMTLCARVRKGNTWISEDMVKAYCELHRLGFAHSVEVWSGQQLVGGLYGVSMGSCFFGESMFSLMDNASKTAMIALTQEIGFSMIDCQVYSRHLESLGAVEISRRHFLKILDEGLSYETLRGSWSFLNQDLDNHPSFF